ncbi:MAG: hypothetical protein ACLR0M_13620 [[Clostridium] symbiosum]
MKKWSSMMGAVLAAAMAASSDGLQRHGNRGRAGDKGSAGI